MDVNLVTRAYEYATKAHAGVTRRYTGDPYINHPVRVAQKIAAFYLTDAEVVAAAFLHDVVEDVEEITVAHITNEFGQRVGSIVDGLTDPPRPQGMRRAEHKLHCNERLFGAMAEVQDIKCADMEDNLPNIILHDPSFAKVYVTEKEQTILGLTRANPVLRGFVTQIIANYRA